jgi:predicted enzyme related to lactoylglutathione lyase
MAEALTAIINKPAWVDLASKDPAASRAFYAKLFGWDIEVNPDPLYGGYGIAKVGGHDAAGIGGAMSEDQPSAWSVYIGTDDVDALAKSVAANGGTVVMAPFDVGDQGKMAVFQDPTGAFISAWQGTRMGGFQTQGPNAFGWADLNTRGVEKAVSFYEKVFGWSPKPTGTPERPYTEFQVDGESIGGATEIDPMVPREVPGYWMVYFTVVDVDTATKTATEAGAQPLVPPVDFPGGRMAIIRDPEGAAFGLMTLSER